MSVRPTRLAAVTACAAVAIASVSGQAFASSSPSGYRAKLNGICRGYTPKFKKLEAAADAAAASDSASFGTHLGRMMVLALEQDYRVTRVPVPATLAGTMKPIFGLLDQADRHVMKAIGYANRGNGQGMVAELTAMGKLAPRINRLYDAAGLRACGSKQT